MKSYRSYIRAILLSIVAAVAIDFIINTEAYKEGWLALFESGADTEEQTYAAKPKLPTQIGKITALVFSAFTRS